MSLLKKIDGVLCKMEEYILSLGIIGMSSLLVGNVIMRVVFNNSWSFAEEIGQLMVIIVTFVGISYATRKGRHIRMTALYDAAPFKVKKAMVLIISFVTMAVMFYFAYLGLRYTLMVADRGRVTPALEWARYLFVMFLPFGFFMGGVQYLVNFMINLLSPGQIYTGNEEVEEDVNCATPAPKRAANDELT